MLPLRVALTPPSKSMRFAAHLRMVKPWRYLVGRFVVKVVAMKSAKSFVPCQPS
ncbi:hypothetical protein [Streptomyces sp. NBC_01264]|uniref:hypothetical protein n=1 Tax=Streptomyces sp. NBC_01264 TaxID=2903804 RepID=UPI0022559E2C|nr:hypothetical protein [Streptomyces sp. NBC_01264]MCX4781998.1 hypothetical protein [Streptomyces sp. NBC_01264]